MSERRSASSEDLHERVEVLDLVGVLLGGGVNTGHALVLGGARRASLHRVNVDAGTVGERASEEGDGLVSTKTVVRSVDDESSEQD